ncbi:hypothetical protein DLM75_21855 [Leptospira stimsonii]|uniref:Uncharacterized protein n=1 Tax=Leptospira stimsonii TaxID=2202203 RepID=A0A396YPH8_9LEPT|nr:hypothetical protein DLM75_21855 [Leptospira stimsonii]
MNLLSRGQQERKRERMESTIKWSFNQKTKVLWEFRQRGSLEKGVETNREFSFRVSEKPDSYEVKKKGRINPS